MKTLWSHDFIEAYRKSQKVKFKFSRYETPQERKFTDVKETQLNRQACFLFDWLIKGRYAKAGKYKVRFNCAICDEELGAKKWSGSTFSAKSAHGNFVCKKCNALIAQIRKTGKARQSKRLDLLLEKHLVALKEPKKMAS